MTTQNHSLIPAWVDGVLRPFDKLETHKLGLRHKAVSVFLLDGDDILLQRRAAGKYHTPGLWANTCCTHPHWKEPSLDCGIRRLKEELGITGVDLIQRGHVEYRADVGGGLIEHEEVDLFSAQVSKKTLEVLPCPEEVDAVSWISAGALEADMETAPEKYTPWLRVYMREHKHLIL